MWFLHVLKGVKIAHMEKNLDIITYAISLIAKAAIFAAQFSGRVRKRSLKRLATMDINEKDKEILFLRPIFYTAILQVFVWTAVVRRRFALGTTNSFFRSRKFIVIIARLGGESPSPERLPLPG